MTSSELPQAFKSKKSSILDSLSIPTDTYTDKSPKGSIDAPIRELIDELNGIDGLVTTSSCSGRVAVFLEGPSTQIDAQSSKVGSDRVSSDEEDTNGLTEQDRSGLKTRGGPGGKGGGRWLFVSHEVVSLPSPIPNEASPSHRDYFTKLCGLERRSLQASATRTSTEQSMQKQPRLIRLSFSPLILHVLTATLPDHARPLLSAAINAGFRESGVQSLAALDHHVTGGGQKNTTAGTGTMVAIRTAGLTFETIIGRVRVEVDAQGNEKEVMEALVDEDYLSLCFEIINERFEWNESRKERLRDEIRKAFARINTVAESKEERRQRKKKEGLRIQAEKEKEAEQHQHDQVEIDVEDLRNNLQTSTD